MDSNEGSGCLPIFAGMVLGLLVIGGSFYAGSEALAKYHAEGIRRECAAIDDALATYSAYHSGSRSEKVYPRTLAALGIVESDKGSIDLSKFDYEVRVDENTRTVSYKLGAHLPGGQYFVSRGSNQEL